MSNIIREGVEPYSTIFERLDAIEASITAITNNISTISNSVSTLSNGVSTVTNKVSSLTNTVSQANEKIAELENSVNEVASDTGWKNLTLASGVSVYSSAQQPRYKKIGKFVILTGAVKGVKQDRTIIGTLPAGFRPSKVISFVQNMSATNGIANIARWQVQTDGDIEMQYNDFPWEELDGTEWFPIDVIFVVD